MIFFVLGTYQQLKELEMEFEVKALPRPEDPFNWKNCQKKISEVTAMTKTVETMVGCSTCETIEY